MYVFRYVVFQIVCAVVVTLSGLVAAKPPEGYRATPDTYHNHNHHHHHPQQQQAQQLSPTLQGQQTRVQHHGLEHGQLPVQPPLQVSQTCTAKFGAETFENDRMDTSG